MVVVGSSKYEIGRESLMNLNELSCCAEAEHLVTLDKLNGIDVR